MDLCVFAIFQFSMDLCAFSYVMIRIKLRTYVISWPHCTNVVYDRGIFYFLFYAGTVPVWYSDLECCGTGTGIGTVQYRTGSGAVHSYTYSILLKNVVVPCQYGTVPEKLCFKKSKFHKWKQRFPRSPQKGKKSQLCK